MKRACDTEVRPANRSLAARYAGQTVLAIGAHPDDIEFGCAGTLFKLSRAGFKVHMLILTSGEVGGDSRGELGAEG